MTAIDSNDWQTVQQLRTAHPDIPMALDAQMRYAVQVAAGKVVFHLQSSGVDPFGPDLEASEYAIRKGSADAVGFLLTRKPGRGRAALLCAKSESTGNTALHLAVGSGDPAKLKLILATHARAKLGKDALDATDAKGKSPLALALEAGKFDMADHLLESGAKPLAQA